jgi:signal transduction histidine kinase
MTMLRPLSSIRSLLAGFAGLLVLMGGLAVDAALQTRTVSAASAALRRESRDRDALLDQLRNDTYRSATLARDYILERDNTLAAGHKGELQQLRSAGEQALRRYAEKAPDDEKAAVRSLQRISEAYWASLAPALDWDRVDGREFAAGQRGETFLRETIIPSRNQVVQFAKQVSELDERALDAAEERIQAVQLRFQRRVTALSFASLVFGLILAIVVVLHAQRLGIEANSRFNETLAAREDMRRLSDRLIAVQEEERRNLSRELHDELGQVMSAMLFELGKLDTELAAAGMNRNSLASARTLAEENVAKVRDMALLLRPAMLDELGLIPALRWQAREVGRRSGLRVKLIADEFNDDLSDSSRTCIFRVVQEALNNCVKHSGAQEVRVAIHRDDEGLSISVADDGVGFDPARHKGLGLLGMMERVSGLGGYFHIDSQPGHGTVLSTYFRLEAGRCQPEASFVPSGSI